MSSGRATPALAALSAAGVAFEVVKFGHDPREASFGAEAVRELAQAYGIAPQQVYKTLIIAAPEGLAIAILPAPARLSVKAAATALGFSRAAMADPADAQRATGYVVGAVSPFGQRRRLPTVVDTDALSRDRIFCSAGRRGWDVAVAPADLIRLTDAVTADIQTH